METAKIIEISCLIVILVLSLSLHEYAHALVAYLRGDDTAKQLGRMTPNPIAHIDPMMTIIVPAVLYFTTGFMFGGAKPVPVVMRRLRHPLRDMMFVAIAGPLTNLLLAGFFMLMWKVSMTFGGYGKGDLLPSVLLGALSFNLLLAVFNMLPIPPLDGSRVMAYLLPQPLREPYVNLERFGLLLVIGIIFFVPGVQPLLHGAMEWLSIKLYDLTGGDWRR
ncbi:MAG: site-2 protease family protein [Planctomycetota bacterium]